MSFIELLSRILVFAYKYDAFTFYAYIAVEIELLPLGSSHRQYYAVIYKNIHCRVFFLAKVMNSWQIIHFITSAIKKRAPDDVGSTLYLYVNQFLLDVLAFN